MNEANQRCNSAKALIKFLISFRSVGVSMGDFVKCYGQRGGAAARIKAYFTYVCFMMRTHTDVLLNNNFPLIISQACDKS